MSAYIKLSLSEKADLLWKRGLFIENYSDNSMTVNLYFLHNYFVEVIVNHQNSRIREITPFKNGLRLEKYLEKVSLQELI